MTDGTSGTPATGDLAQAIVALARDAERRRGARSHLIEATNVVALAIRDLLRTGDNISLDGTSEPQPDGTAGPVDYWADLGRPAGTPARGVPVLTRNRAMLGLPIDARGTYRDQGNVACHAATIEEREKFVAELPAVIAAFRELLQEDADRYERLARGATKLTPR